MVVWGGGVYDWFDPISLVRAVERVRASVPDIRLVFLGMANPNPGIPEMDRAVELRRVSDELGLSGSTVFFNDRWVPYQAWGGYLLDADIAVSIHLDNLETAVLVPDAHPRLSVGPSTHDPHRRRCTRRPRGRARAWGSRCGPGTSTPSREALTRLLSDGLPGADFGPMLERFRWPVVAGPLLRWLEHPRRAPDARASELDAAGTS